MSLVDDLNKNFVGSYVELIDIDLTDLGGDIIYIVPGQYADTNVIWRGHTYQPVPLETSGFDQQTEGAPPRPKLAVSNVNLFLMSAITSMNDMVGGKVTRWRTFARYLDLAPTADPTQHFPIQSFVIAQKAKLSAFEVEFTLISALDRPGNRLPTRQILKDKGFPGAALGGLRGRS